MTLLWWTSNLLMRLKITQKSCYFRPICRLNKKNIDECEGTQWNTCWRRLRGRCRHRRRESIHGVTVDLFVMIAVTITREMNPKKIMSISIGLLCRIFKTHLLMLWLLLWLKFNDDDADDDDDDDEVEDDDDDNDVLFALTTDAVPFDRVAAEWKERIIFTNLAIFHFSYKKKLKIKMDGLVFLLVVVAGACEFDIISSCCCWIRCAMIADETGRSISPNLSECRISGVCFICAWSSSSFGKANCKSCI